MDPMNYADADRLTILLPDNPRAVLLAAHRTGPPANATIHEHSLLVIMHAHTSCQAEATVGTDSASGHGVDHAHELRGASLASRPAVAGVRPEPTRTPRRDRRDRLESIADSRGSSAPSRFGGGFGPEDRAAIIER
jgi:hypothetical protein